MKTGSNYRPHIALAILTLVNFISSYDRIQIPALVQLIKVDFGLSDTEVGMITGLALGIPTALAVYPLALLSDRWKRIPVLTIALVGWSLMTGFAGLAVGFWTLFVTRAGVATGEAAFGPNAHSIIASHFPPERRSFAIAFETIGSNLGYFIGLAAAGWLAYHLGWRHTLLIAAIPGLVMAVIVARFLKEGAVLPEPAINSVNSGSEVKLTALLREKTLVLLILAAICFPALSSIWIQWLPSFYMRVHHAPLTQVGFFVGTASGIGLIMGSILGGLVGNIRPSAGRSKFLAGSFLFAATVPIALGALLAQSYYLSLALVFACTILTAAVAPIVFSGIQDLCPPSFRARGSALAFLGIALVSYAIMPVAVGFISDLLLPTYGELSLRYAMLLLLVAPTVGCALLYVVHKRQTEQLKTTPAAKSA